MYFRDSIMVWYRRGKFIFDGCRSLIFSSRVPSQNPNFRCGSRIWQYGFSDSCSKGNQFSCSFSSISQRLGTRGVVGANPFLFGAKRSYNVGPNFRPIGRWFLKASRVVFYGVMVVGSMVFISFIWALSLDPIPHSEIERMAGDYYFRKLKADSKGKILPPTHQESVRVRMIAQHIIDATLQRFQLDGWKWDVLVVDDPSVSARCFPGGGIVVHTGLLNHFTSYADVATIIAHEVGRAVVHNKEAGSCFGYSHVGDHIGLVLMALAGYDPRMAPKVLEKLEMERLTGNATTTQAECLAQAERKRAEKEKVTEDSTTDSRLAEALARDERRRAEMEMERITCDSTTDLYDEAEMSRTFYDSIKRASEIIGPGIRAKDESRIKAEITEEALTIYDQNVWAGRGVQEFPQSSAGT